MPYFVQLIESFRGNRGGIKVVDRMVDVVHVLILDSYLVGLADYDGGHVGDLGYQFFAVDKTVPYF